MAFKEDDEVVLVARPRTVFRVVKVKGDKLTITDGRFQRDVTLSLYRKLTKLERAIRQQDHAHLIYSHIFETTPRQHGDYMNETLSEISDQARKTDRGNFLLFKFSKDKYEELLIATEAYGKNPRKMKNCKGFSFEEHGISINIVEKEQPIAGLDQYGPFVFFLKNLYLEGIFQLFSVSREPLFTFRKLAVN